MNLALIERPCLSERQEWAIKKNPNINLGPPQAHIHRYTQGPTYTYIYSHAGECAFSHMYITHRCMTKTLLVGVIYKEKDVVYRLTLKSLPLAHPLGTCFPGQVLYCRTFRGMGAQPRSRLLCGLFEGCHSGPGSCRSFFTMVWAASAALLLTLHHVFSNVIDQDPLKPWAKSNLSSVVSIRDCDCSSIQMTNTDVLLEKSFRDHLPLCWGFLFCCRPLVQRHWHCCTEIEYWRGWILFYFCWTLVPNPIGMEYFSPTWRRIAVPMTSIWVLGHCERGSIFRLLDILEFSLGYASSLPTIGSGS